MSEISADSRPTPNRRHRKPAALHEQIAARRVIADEVISLAHLLGRSVISPAGAGVGTVSDIVVRGAAGVSHPPVVSVLARVRRGLAALELQDITLTQT